MPKRDSKSDLRKWRRKGFRTETGLVKMLSKNGYSAVRVPVSNPSINPLPDVIARRDLHVYALEVKNVDYYAYFPRKQVEKLFQFLDQMIPIPNQCKHAVLVAHMGKRWIFKEILWEKWEKGKLPEKERILKRDKGNFSLEKGCRK